MINPAKSTFFSFGSMSITSLLYHVSGFARNMVPFVPESRIHLSNLELSSPGRYSHPSTIKITVSFKHGRPEYLIWSTVNFRISVRSVFARFPADIFSTDAFGLSLSSYAGLTSQI